MLLTQLKYYNTNLIIYAENPIKFTEFVCNIKYAKQKHLGCEKVQGQSEATLQTGRRDQKV